MTNNITKGSIFAILSGICSGAFGYFGVVALEQSILSELDVLFWRYLLASIFMLILVVVRLKNNIFMELAKNRNEFLPSFLMGFILYGGLGSWLYLKSCLLIGTGLAMVIFFLYPIILAILNLIFFKEPITKFTMISLLLIVIGCSLLSVDKTESFNILGVIYALLSAFCAALFLIGRKKYIKNIETSIFSLMLCIGGCCSFVATIYWQNGQIQLPSDYSSASYLFAAGVICTALSTYFINLALDFISSTRAAIMTVLQPVVAIALGVLFLKEEINIYEVVGAALICLNAAIIQFEK